MSVSFIAAGVLVGPLAFGKRVLMESLGIDVARMVARAEELHGDGQTVPWRARV
jgi:hypothetical protein